MRRGECQVSSGEWIETEKKMKQKITVLGLCAMLFALWSSAEAQQTEAKVPPSPVRGEISLSNSEQQPLPNQHKYKWGIQLTHDLSPCRRGGDPTTGS